MSKSGSGSGIPAPATPHRNVVIVGGGMAGLAAAKTLGELGIDRVLLLEAKNKLGGRVATVQMGSGHVEMGAQWIHGQDNELFKLAFETGNVHDEKSVEGVGEFRTPNGDIIPPETVEQVINKMQDHLNSIEDTFHIDQLYNHENGFSGRSRKSYASVGSFLALKQAQMVVTDDPKLSRKERAIKAGIWDWKLNFERIDNSCNSLDSLSLYRWGEFEDCSDKPYNNFKNGAQSFVDMIANDPAVAAIEMKLLSAVYTVTWASASEKPTRYIVVTYIDPDGELQTVFTRALLFTGSIGVLKQANGISHDMFEPPLPEKVDNVIQALGFDSITKIFLEWETPWWDPRTFKGIQLVWPDYPGYNGVASPPAANWVTALQGFDPVLDNPNVLMAWASGKSAVQLEKMDPDEVGAVCTVALRKFTKNDDMELPIKTLVSKWGTDPFTGGAYSYRSVETHKFPGDLTEILAQPLVANANVPNPLFLLAGEALHPTQYSTLHGAFESGQTQAKKIAKYLAEEST